jgi:protein CpxP
MKNSIQLQVLTLALSTGLIFATNAHAQWEGSGNWREKKDAKIQEVYDQLDLTPDQKTRLAANKEKNNALRDQVSKEIKENMQALGEELKKPTLDLNKIKTLHSTTKDLRNKMSDQRLESILEVRTILTPEQFAKFTDLIKEDHSK